MEVIPSYSTILEKYKCTKEELEKAESTLVSLTGSVAKQNFPNRYKRDSSCLSHKLVPANGDKNQFKRKAVTSESEESTDEQGLVKHNIQSAVLKVGCIRSKKEVICKQNVNPKVESRNRRILGMLQGTLQKFRDDAEKTKSLDLKRKKVEEKVEAAAECEKERIKKLTFDLMLEKNEKELQLKGLQEMLDVTKNHEVWECHQKHLLNFIITKSNPQIYFLPATHTKTSKKWLEKSKLETLEKIEKHKSEVKKQLAEIRKSYNMEKVQNREFDNRCSENKVAENPLSSTLVFSNVSEDDDECSIISLKSGENDDFLII